MLCQVDQVCSPDSRKTTQNTLSDLRRNTDFTPWQVTTMRTLVRAESVRTVLGTFRTSVV